MNEEPVRLRHDPRFAPALVALSQEKLDSARLAALETRLRARIEAGVGSPPPVATSPTVKVLAGALAGALVVGGGLLFALGRPPAHPAVTPSAEPPPDAAPPPPAPRGELGTLATPGTVGRGALDSSQKIAPVQPPPGQAGVERLASGLAPQVRAYQDAAAALARAEPETALALLDALSAQAPHGALEPEADLLRLEALQSLARHAAAQTLALRLARSPAHGGRRAQLYRAALRAAAYRDDCATIMAIKLESGLPLAELMPVESLPREVTLRCGE